MISCTSSVITSRLPSSGYLPFWLSSTPSSGSVASASLRLTQSLQGCRSLRVPCSFNDFKVVLFSLKMVLTKWVKSIPTSSGGWKPSFSPPSTSHLNNRVALFVGWKDPFLDTRATCYTTPQHLNGNCQEEHN